MYMVKRKNNMTLKERTEQLWKHSINFMGVVGEHPSIITIIGEDPTGEQLAVVPLDNDKLECMTRLGAKCAKSEIDLGVKAKYVFLVAEAWHTMAKKGEKITKRPSEDPKRKECLMLTGMDLATGKSTYKFADIVRKGKKVKLVEPEAYDKGKHEDNLLTRLRQSYQIAKGVLA